MQRSEVNLKTTWKKLIREQNWISQTISPTQNTITLVYSWEPSFKLSETVLVTLILKLQLILRRKRTISFGSSGLWALALPQSSFWTSSLPRQHLVMSVSRRILKLRFTRRRLVWSLRLKRWYFLVRGIIKSFLNISSSEKLKIDRWL